jgi:hypothetical protein
VVSDDNLLGLMSATKRLVSIVPVSTLETDTYFPIMEVPIHRVIVIL